MVEISYATAFITGTLALASTIPRNHAAANNNKNIAGYDYAYANAGPGDIIKKIAQKSLSDLEEMQKIKDISDQAKKDFKLCDNNGKCDSTDDGLMTVNYYPVPGLQVDYTEGLRRMFDSVTSGKSVVFNLDASSGSKTGYDSHKGGYTTAGGDFYPTTSVNFVPNTNLPVICISGCTKTK